MDIVNLKQVKKYNRTLIIKRLFDIVFSIFALVAFLIPGIIIGIVIKCADGGSVFFLQERIGRNGKVFKIIKFRTMKEGSEKKEAELLKKSKNGFVQDKKDKRVTEVGKFLRKTSFDEIPQLVNVLKGDMSLIGPRPFIKIEQDALSQEETNRNLVYPGLTGLAQLKGRSKLNIHEVVKLDIEYINTYSLLSDIKIFFLTIFVVLRGI